MHRTHEAVSPRVLSYASVALCIVPLGLSSWYIQTTCSSSGETCYLATSFKSSSSIDLLHLVAPCGNMPEVLAKLLRKLLAACGGMPKLPGRRPLSVDFSLLVCPCPLLISQLPQVGRNCEFPWLICQNCWLPVETDQPSA